MTLAQEQISVVGATGAVGQEILGLLSERGIPASSVRAYASPRSAGKTLLFGADELTIRSIESLGDDTHTVVLLAASASIARNIGPVLVERGAVVVDNSSAFRGDEDKALIIPEANGDLVRADRTPRIIANPNCSTIIMLVAATPIERAFGVERIIVSTYQAASGAGLEGMNELRHQTRTVLDGNEPKPSFFAEPCAFNVFSHDSDIDPETRLNVEESKMISETRKIWDRPNLIVRPTCMRVPVLRAHAESLHLTLRTPASPSEIRKILSEAPGVRLEDDWAQNSFPTSAKASGGSDVLVGRVRIDPSVNPQPDGRAGACELFVSGDQLLKGAALNAVQIAELVLA
ncbi:MAG: aspartate-semialdehyde dehydrogenase [Planctomycetota bacterium]